MKEVRTRFAPSPTGFQHIGGFRTAMYAWLHARHFGGKFVLRIEDTDQERKVHGAIRYLIESLDWLGIDVDEGPSHDDLRAVGEYWEGAPVYGGGCGPYIQSQRLGRYKEVADKLVELGVAYRCDCTAEMLERERNEQMARKETPGYSGYCRTRNVSPETRHVVRYKIPYGLSLTLIDVVRGRISWDSPPLRDPVVMKSDGFPTYHLANVVDDHDMAISHVMRGEEWLPTTPLHLLLYDALGWERPVFCHLSHILGSDGKKLSKRHGAVSLDVFREQGYLPGALLNYVVLIGWSPGEGDEQEVFTREELIKKFSVEHLNNASGVFDQNKLLWMNGVYARKISTQEFTEVARPFLEKAGLTLSNPAWDIIAPHVQERVKLLTEVPDMVQFLFVDAIERDIPAMFKKDMTPEKAKAVLAEASERLKALPEFSIHAIEEALRSMAEPLGLKVGPLFVVIRIAVTGKTITPPLFESLAALGRERTIHRIEETINML